MTPLRAGMTADEWAADLVANPGEKYRLRPAGRSAFEISREEEGEDAIWKVMVQSGDDVRAGDGALPQRKGIEQECWWKAKATGRVQTNLRSLVMEPCPCCACTIQASEICTM